MPPATESYARGILAELVYIHTNIGKVLDVVFY